MDLFKAACLLVFCIVLQTGFSHPPPRGNAKPIGSHKEKLQAMMAKFKKGMQDKLAVPHQKDVHKLPVPHKKDVPKVAAPHMKDMSKLAAPHKLAVPRKKFTKDVLRAPNTVVLVDGTIASEGRVEVLYFDEWGTVCDDGWGDVDATVVCKQLGHAYGSAVNLGFFGTGSHPIMLDDVSCSSSDEFIWDCPSNGWGIHDCLRAEEAGVRCGNDTGNDLRLVNGTGPHEGRVEVFHNGVWGTVCDDGWTNREARTVCTQLGHVTGTAFGNAYFGQGTGTIWMDNVDCAPTDQFLWDCDHNGWGNENCAHSEDAGVRCSDEEENNELRLVDGDGPHEGRVEVAHNGEWGTVCDDGWDINEARVVCNMLGYRYGTPYSNSFFGPGTLPIMLDQVACLSDDVSLWDCSHNGWGVHDCTHGEDAGVGCTNSTENDIRVRDGPDESQGRVEVLHAGVWGTVCDDGWGEEDARVVCNMLGWNLGVAFGSAAYGPGTGQIWLDQVACRPTDTTLWECPANAWGDHNCAHTEDASVACFDVEPPNDIRLAGGSTPFEGRVEVLHAGAWGTVCDDAWDTDDARTVCKMLGHESGIAYSQAFFGQGTGPIWLDQVNCGPLDTNLFDCPANDWGVNDCSHFEDAGVGCYNGTGNDLRVVDGSGPHEGRVEVFHEGQWGTICDDQWDDIDATVVCQMIGYDTGAAAIRAQFGPGTGPIWLDNMQCTETDFGSDIWDCVHSGWGANNCGHFEDAGVICQPVAGKGTKSLEGQYCDTTNLCCKTSKCVSGTIVADMNDCNTYHKCVDGHTWKHKACPHGEKFDCHRGCVKTGIASCPRPQCGACKP